MSTVTIKMYSLLSDKLGKDELKVMAGNVSGAVERLKEIFGAPLIEALFEGDQIKERYIFLINGHRVFRDNFEKARLGEGDILHIFPPLAGG
jgi:molybdopterin converting factor small subunit